MGPFHGIDHIGVASYQKHTHMADAIYQMERIGKHERSIDFLNRFLGLIFPDNETLQMVGAS